MKKKPSQSRQRKAKEPEKRKQENSYIRPSYNFLADWHGAAVREKDMRESVFLDNYQIHGGHSIRLLNANDLLALNTLGSPFFRGGHPTYEDCAIFVWILSPHFSPEREAYDAFVQTLLPHLGEPEFIKDIFEYIELMFLDMPGSNGESGGGYFSFLGGLVDYIASEYGWQMEEIKRIPLARIFQLQKASILRKGHKVAVFSRLRDKAVSAYLDARNKIPPEHQEQWHKDQWDEIKHIYGKK